MGRTKNGKNGKKMNHRLETKYGGTRILAGDTLPLPHTHYNKFHEDIPNYYRVMGCTRMKITQNKQKTQQQSKRHNTERNKLKVS